MKTLIFAFGVVLLMSGCKNDNNSQDMGGVGDMAGFPPNFNRDMNCYENPTQHVQIINSCGEGIERLEKAPVLPKLNPDGTRPPLP